MQKIRINAEVSLPIELPIEQAEEVVVQVLKDDYDRLNDSIMRLRMKDHLENYQKEDLSRDVEVRDAVRTLLSYYMVNTDYQMFMRNRL
jgi:hypothetical protein